jgi:hypothetical protein
MGSLAFVALLLLQWPEDAPAQHLPQCDMRIEQTQRLAGFHETQLGWKLLSSGALLELWGGESGTWTLMETTPEGISCIVKTGEGAPSHRL